jgi:hypothetical protein
MREHAIDIGALAIEQMTAQIKEEQRIKQELQVRSIRLIVYYASSSKEGVDVVISPSYDRRKPCTKRRRAEPRRRKTRSGDERRKPPRPGDAVQRRAAKPLGPPPDKRARTMKMVRLAFLLFNKTLASIATHRKLLRCCCAD